MNFEYLQVPGKFVFVWKYNHLGVRGSEFHKLIGDDGECRIVSKLTSGVDEMYEINEDIL